MNLSVPLKNAVRNLARHPGFACAAVLILALGIGATCTVFTIVHSVLIRQLPFKDPSRLVWIWVTLTDRDKAFFSIPNFLDMKRQATTFAGLGAFANLGANVTGSGEPERLQGVRITANAFQLFGVLPALGRTIEPDDGDAGSERVVVITYGLWKRRFGGDAHAIGKTIDLNGDAYTIVGVLPLQFSFPVATDSEFAIPLNLETDPRRAERGSRFLRGFGRLNPEGSITQAQSELAGIFERLRNDYPNENGKHTPPRVVPLHKEVVGDYAALLWTLQSAVGVVLLMTCSNLANLLLARSAIRRKELAVRIAIGAGRSDLFAQLLAESLLIGISGGTLGLLMTSAGLSLVISGIPAGLPRAAEISIDATVVMFAAVISILAALLFGVAPARTANRFDLSEELRGASSNSGRPKEVRMRRMLVTFEVAMAVLLLTIGGLFVRSFRALQSVEPGVESDHLLQVRLSIQKPAAFHKFYDDLIRRLHTLPGIESAAIANVIPLSGMNTRTDFTIVGQTPGRLTDIPGAQSRWVSRGYFIPGSLGRAAAIQPSPHRNVCGRSAFPFGDAGSMVLWHISSHSAAPRLGYVWR